MVRFLVFWPILFAVFFAALPVAGREKDEFVNGELPRSFMTDSLFTGEPPDTGNCWWKSFGDEILDSLIILAVKNNPDIYTALDNIVAARAALRTEQAGFYPDIGVSAGWSKSRGSRTLDSDNILGYADAMQEYLFAKASASWEIDLFGKITTGVKSAKYAYEADKNDTDVLQRLAVCAQMLQYNNDAINYWNTFIALKPEDPIAYNQLLDLYFHENKYQYYLTRAKLKTIEGRLAQAADDYKKAVNNTTEEKEIIAARYLLAQTYEILNKSVQAIDEYLKILDYDHNENVYLSLAGLYYAEDKQAALDMLQRAIKEYPDSSAVKEFLCKVYLLPRQ